MSTIACPLTLRIRHTATERVQLEWVCHGIITRTVTWPCLPWPVRTLFVDQGFTLEEVPYRVPVGGGTP